MKANADYLAQHLRPFGWQYVVLDFCWSHPSPKLTWSPDLTIEANGALTPPLEMDGYGRLYPAPNRFPSAIGGAGLKPLGTYLHGLGLKFGLHIMRGIPRQAVRRNLPVFGTQWTAADIADPLSTCPWLNHMVGVDMSKPGAQAYYDSLLQLYAEWGVDYLKADDMSYPYAAAEIVAIRRAIEKCGRPIVLSLSPGPCPVREAAHVRQYADMWRISADFWDNWPQLMQQFRLCADWAAHTGPDGWADADHLALGKLSVRGPQEAERWTNFSLDEQFTHLTLWAIFRSPLMMGGELTHNDAWTNSLLTHEAVLAVNQHSTGNRLLFERDGQVVWCASEPGSGDTYLAVFNLNDAATTVEVQLAELGLSGLVKVQDVWARRDLCASGTALATPLRPHASALYRLHALGAAA
jgi:hypothetical protein